MFELGDDDTEPAEPPRAVVNTPSPNDTPTTDDTTTHGDGPAAAVLPPIREATPVRDLSASEQADVVASNSGEVSVVPESTTSTSEVPLVAAPVAAQPAVAPAPPPMSLPSQHVAPAASSAYVGTTDPVEVPAAPKTRKQRRGGGLGLFLTLLVLAGLVAGGIVYGRQYLFPDDWEDNARPFAESVEETRGVDFVEPVVVTPEPPPQFEQRMAGQTLGVWESDLALWRTFGLASGTVNEETFRALVAGSEPAMYSVDDGQVYHDTTLVGTELDARVTEALAIAALDQDHGWSVRQSVRTLDDEAMTLASVRRQAEDILAASDFGIDLDDASRSTLDSLPPVLAYRVGAPDVFAELLTSPDPVADNPLAGLEVRGPGPIGNEELVLGPEPEVPVGAEIVRQAQAMESSFWYLALAGYLPGNMSYDTTKLITQSSLTVADEDGTVCSYATFAAATPDEDAIIAAVLGAWVANAPAEMNASVTGLPLGTQLRSCDPGEGFDAVARPGVAHELTMWRAGELVATQAVTNRQGIEADITTAIAAMRSSGVGDAMIALPSSSSAGDLADQVTDAMAPIIDPAPAAPATEE